MKRPYSTAFTARGKPRRYLLSGIPPGLWEKAQRKARMEHVALRQVILAYLAQWVEEPLREPAKQAKSA